MNFLNKIVPKNKKNVLLLLGLTALVIFSLPLAARAGLGDVIVGALTAIPALLVVVTLAFSVWASQISVLLAGVILNWVTSPGFISLSYTSPTGANANPIIAIGLDITKNFVNLALVVILVYIAVSIALRLEREGDAKKLFVRLIIIALLVNFAPVIVGLIVDAANIVMNYFLVGIEMGISDVFTQSKSLASAVASKLIRVPSFWTQISLITQAFITIALNLATALILFLFAALFLFRYIVIWVLVILSPLAFVAWILPITKKYWDMWWSQLIQWSIIGIVAAFFLYLGARAYEALPAYFAIKTEMPGIEPEVTGVLNQTMPFFAVAVFLILGFLMGLQTSAMGASTAIGLTKKGGAWMGKKGLRGGRIVAGRALGEKGKSWLQKQASARLPAFEGKSLLGKIGTGLGYATLTAPTYWALRRGLGEAGLGLSESAKKDINAAEKQYGGTTAQRKLTGLRSPKILLQNQVGILRQAIEEGQVENIKYDAARNPSGLRDNEIVKIGRQALRIDPEEFKKIRDSFPHLAEQMGQGFSDEAQRTARVHPAQAAADGYANVMEMTLARMRSDQIAKMDISPYYRDPAGNLTAQAQQMRAAMHQFWTGEQLGTAGRFFGRKFLDEFQTDINTQVAADPHWYQDNNKVLFTYLQSSAARSLGLRHP